MSLRNPLFLVIAGVLLSGCAAPPHQVHQLHNEVSQLNQKMGDLTRQASALEQQNSLNSGSSQGAWLVPEANSPVVLQSQLGHLTLSLSNIEGDATGTQAVLHIRTTGGESLPAFSGWVEGGQRDSATGKPLTATGQRQRIHVNASLVARDQVTVPLTFNDIQPDQLGYFRIHDLLADNP